MIPTLTPETLTEFTPNLTPEQRNRLMMWLQFSRGCFIFDPSLPPAHRDAITFFIEDLGHNLCLSNLPSYPEETPTEDYEKTAPWLLMLGMLAQILMDCHINTNLHKATLTPITLKLANPSPLDPPQDTLDTAP